MLNLETTSKRSLIKTAEKVTKFFGEKGLGLDQKSNSPDCLTFEGGGGYVNVMLCADKEKTILNFETREWENQVKKFVEGL